MLQCINAEFDLLPAAIQLAGSRQEPKRRSIIDAVLVVLETGRVEVLEIWGMHELPEQWKHAGHEVRRLVFEDFRYQAIQNDMARLRAGAVSTIFQRLRK